MPSQHPTNASDRHRCTTCDKVYSTNSHLRRHEATHSGRHDLTCPICGAKFTRRDLARRHVQGCSASGQDVILPTAKRGRKRASCDKCSQRKLSCDSKLPCTRCRSSAVTCTYGRLNPGAAFAPQQVNLHLQSNSSAAANAENSSAVDRGRISIDFLLNFTNPADNSQSAIIAAEAFDTSSSGDEVDHQVSEVNTEGHYLQLGFRSIDFNDYSSPLFGYPFSILGDEALEALPLANVSLPSSEGTSALEDRLSQVVDELSSQHDAMLSRGVSVQANFDEQVARATFTTENVNYCVRAFFRCYFDELHLFHGPSFSVHTTSFPLLITVVLFGSMSSSQSDVSVALRQCFDVAEEYVFGRLALKSSIPCPPQEYVSNDDVELYQAGLLFMIILNNNSNLTVRRRIRLQRHSSLVAAVRNSGLFSYRRRDLSNATEDYLWQVVVADEARIRIGAWTFMLDSAVTIFFNTAPQVALSEMTGDLPCEDRIFRVKSLSNLECVAFAERQAMSGWTLRDLTSFLLSTAPETPAPDQTLITEEILLMLINALHSMIQASRANFTQDVMVESLFGALQRWKRLWDSANKPVEAEVVPHRGFQRHAPEYWWLAMSILKAVQLRDDECRYMQPVPSDSVQPLHDFVCRYKDFTG